MATIKLAYVNRYKDRFGKARHYFRRKGCKAVVLPGLPGSPEFMAAYAEAIGAAKPTAGANRVVAKSFAHMLSGYYMSKEFKGLMPQTQRGHRGVYKRAEERWSKWPAEKIESQHVEALMDDLAESPGAALTLLKRLKTLFGWAKKRKLIPVNPAEDVKPPRNRSEGFTAWSDTDVQQFENHWPLGSKPRMALALFLYTGQRRSDVVTMGWQHVKDGWIAVRQIKTGEYLDLPVHPSLQAILAAQPKTNMTFLMTEYGKPFTAKGFGAWFKDKVEAAGLSGLNAHGLRKATAKRLAEGGCSAFQIAAVTGHRSLKELEVYTRSASQKHLAQAAIATMKVEP